MPETGQHEGLQNFEKLYIDLPGNNLAEARTAKNLYFHLSGHKNLIVSYLFLMDMIL